MFHLVSLTLLIYFFVDFVVENGKADASYIESSDLEQCGKPVYCEHLVAGGVPAQLKELPWHAGVYSKLFIPYKQKCGGSLVSSSVVISAAQCFWDSKQLPPENYAVAVGKIHRPYNYHEVEEYQQKSDVREIHIPPRFYGSNTRFQDDLALLILASPVTFTNAVKPICLDFNYEFDLLQLKDGSLGKVGGWGLTSEDGIQSPTLQVAQLPYIDIEECMRNATNGFREYITCDKFCAGYSNGTAVCEGDSGGGLAFPHTVADETRYYLRGVVSSAPRTEHKCNVFHWVTFTHLQRHQHYIQTTLGLKSER